MNTALFYDTETTDWPVWKSPSGGDNQPHLVQLAAILADVDTQRVISSLNVIIRPDGWEIPQDTIDIHGISNEMAHEVGVSEELAFRMFIEMWGGDQVPRVAHNKTFDQRIIRIAAKRYATEIIIDAWADKESHECTMQLSKPIMRMPQNGRGGYKPPKLSEAYKYFTGKDLKNAHTAMADAKACMEVYFALDQLKAA